MRAMRAQGFGGYQDLKLTDIPSPSLSEGRILLRMTAAGITPLDYTILSGQSPMAKAPLVLGNEGAGIVEGGGTAEYPNGARVMFTGPLRRLGKRYLERVGRGPEGTSLPCSRQRR